MHVDANGGPLRDQHLCPDSRVTCCTHSRTLTYQKTRARCEPLTYIVKEIQNLDLRVIEAPLGPVVVETSPRWLRLVGRHRRGGEMVPGGTPPRGVVVEIVVCHEGE